nr:colicin D domain-containing protein [Brevibacillus laterosporus]
MNKYEYDLWGNVESKQENMSNPFLYAGELYDEESGLIYLRARYYDPNDGRFITEDTYKGQVDNPLSLNRYSYSYNNPLRYLDPSRHKVTANNLNGANIILNELKEAWTLSPLDERKAYEDQAKTIRNQMRASGIREEDILQSNEPYITIEELKNAVSFDIADKIILSGIVIGSSTAKVEMSIGTGTFKPGNNGTLLSKGLPAITISAAKLQKKWKHASDFGVSGNFNRSNAEIYKEAIEGYVQSANQIYQSTYRGQSVYVYMKDEIGVYTDLAGNFISGWKFTKDQINFHIKSGIPIK